MSQEAIHEEIGPKMFPLRIIHVAMVVGLVAYLFVWLSPSQRESARQGSMHTVALAFAAVATALSFALPIVVRRAGVANLKKRAAVTTGSMLGVYHTAFMIGMALLEGAGLFAAMTVPGAPQWFLAVPVGILALMLARFPRQDAVAEWIAANGVSGAHGNA